MKKLVLIFFFFLFACEDEYEVNIGSRDTESAEIRREGDGSNSWRKVYVPYRSGKLTSFNGKNKWYVRKTTELGSLNVSLVKHDESFISFYKNRLVDNVKILAPFDSAFVED